MPPRGFLFVKYYSGEGKGLCDCRPDVPLRKSLFHLVGITEEIFLKDESNQIFEKRRVVTTHGEREVSYVSGHLFSDLVGDKCAMDHRSLWEVFLTPFNSSSARIAAGEKVISVFNEIRIRSGGKDPYNLHVILPPKYTGKKIAGGKSNVT